MRRLIAFVWKTLAGIALCLTPVTAVLVVGWIARAMQRSTYKSWFKQSGTAPGASTFREFMLAEQGTAHLASWPNWIISDKGQRNARASAARSGLRARLSSGFGNLLGSVWSNLTTGLQMLVNTWVLTLPACVLWAVSWWGGWENSFNKGYEQAAVAPLIGLAGAAVFLAAMTYVPLAQARQAATGHWKAFYDFRFLRALARQSRWLVVWLAISFAVAGLIVAGVHVGPLAVGNLLDANTSLSEQDIEKMAGLYHLAAGAVIFVLVVFLRLAAARVYAKAVYSGLRRGAIDPELLADNERSILARLEMLDQTVKPSAGLVTRTFVMSGRGIAGVFLTLVLLAVWFVFVAELFASQFLNHSWVGWLNLPLIQVPWFYGP